MRRRHKVLWSVLALVLVMPVVAVLFLYASVSGGWDDAFRPKKTAASGEVRDARKDAGPVLAREADDLGLTIGQPDERCLEGQHNWKIDDEYDVSCELVATAPVDRDGLDAFGAQLAAAGWRPESGLGLDRTRAERGTAYYERGDDLRLTVEWYSGAGEATLRYRFYED